MLSAALLLALATGQRAGAQYPVAPTPIVSLGSLTREPRLSGYLSLRETLRSDTATFIVNRARVGVQALPADFVAVRLQVDFAAIGRTTGADGDSIPALQVTDAFVQLGVPDTASRIAQMLRPALMIGQFRTPFGLENLTSSTTVLTASRSLASERLATKRDRGVQLQVRFPQFVNLGVAVVDGEGTNRTSNPDGRHQAIGRLTVRPIPTVSVSGKWAGQGADHRWGYDARWAHGPAVLEAELVEREGPTNATTGIDARGGYALAAYRILPWLQPVVKWEQLHEELIAQTETEPLVSASRSTLTTIGVNFIAPQDRARMQLNWIGRSDRPTRRKGELVAQIQAVF